MIQQKSPHRSPAEVKFTALQVSQSCWSHCVIQVMYFPCQDMDCSYVQKYIGERHQGAFPPFLDGEEWDVTCCLSAQWRLQRDV